MSNQQKEIGLEMRLLAIEYLLCKSYLVVTLATGQLDPADFDKFRAEFLEGAKKQTFPGVDAAMSDHLSAEWEGAIERLLDLQKEMLVQVLQKREGRG